MLKEKPQCDSIEYMDMCKMFDGEDGPPNSYAVTESGETYVYICYAIGVKNVDKTSAEITLWVLTRDTLENLLRESGFDDPIILWRERPFVSEEGNKNQIYMRCVIVPRGTKFLPDEMPHVSYEELLSKAHSI